VPGLEDVLDEDVGHGDHTGGEVRHAASPGVHHEPGDHPYSHGLEAGRKRRIGIPDVRHHGVHGKTDEEVTERGEAEHHAADDDTLAHIVVVTNSKHSKRTVRP